MPSFDEAVAQLRGPEAAGFGFSEPQAERLVNQGIKEYAAESEWIRVILDLGPIVAGVSVYDLPAHVVKTKRLRVGTSPYSRQDLETLWDLEAGLASLTGAGGVFVPTYDEEGKERSITLWPPPGEEDVGQPVKVLAAIIPEKDLAGADQLPFPEDRWRGALNGAKAIAYEDVDENPEQAEHFRALMKTEAAELRERANSQVGQGPVRFPVAGRE